MKGIPAFPELLGVIEHALAAIRGDDAELDRAGITHAVHVGVMHRARMEGRDLVVVEVGRDEGLGREGIGDHRHVLVRDAERLQMGTIAVSYTHLTLPTN